MSGVHMQPGYRRGSTHVPLPNPRASCLACDLPQPSIACWHVTQAAGQATDTRTKATPRAFTPRVEQYTQYAPGTVSEHSLQPRFAQGHTPSQRPDKPLSLRRIRWLQEQRPWIYSHGRREVRRYWHVPRLALRVTCGTLRTIPEQEVGDDFSQRGS